MDPKKFNKWVEKVCKKLDVGVPDHLTLYIKFFDDYVQINIREHAEDPFIARSHLQNFLFGEKFTYGYGWIVTDEGFLLYRDIWHLEKGEE